MQYKNEDELMYTHTIAVLTVDGENYSIDGCYQGKQRKPKWYNVVRGRDCSLQVEHLSEFPSCDKLRELLN